MTHTFPTRTSSDLRPDIVARARASAGAGRARDRVRGALERRQVVAAQRADQSQWAGAHVGDAGPDAGAQLFRRRRTADLPAGRHAGLRLRSEEHTSELQSLMRISYAVFCLKKKKNQQ